MSRVSHKFFAFFAALSVAFFDCVPFAVGGALTLAEKIEMARKMAEDAASGKSSAGMVVDASINIAEIAKRAKAISVGVGEYQSKALSDAMRSAEKDAEADYARVLKQNSESRQTRLKTAVSEGSVAAVVVVKTEKNDATKSSDSEKLKPVDTQKNFVNGIYVGKIEKPFKSEDVSQKKADRTQKKLHEENVDVAKILAALPKNRVVFSENSAFKIFKNASGSSLSAKVVSDACVEMFAHYFGGGEKSVFARKVELRLLDRKTFGNLGNLRGTFAELSDNGGVVLSVRWDKNLKLRDFCELISGGLLRSLAFSAGSKNWKTPPPWLECALSADLEQRVRFGVTRDFARTAIGNPKASPFEILSMRGAGDFSHSQRSWAFWNLEALEQIFNIHLHGLLSDNLRNPESSVSVFEAAAKKYEISDFIARWRCVVTGKICRKLTGISTLEDSKAELQRLAVLPCRKADGNIAGVAGADIFLRAREDAEFAASLEARILEIKVGLGRVNPAYYNCYVILGRILEAAAEDDREDFDECLVQFAAEVKKSSKIADMAVGLMERDSR